MNKLSDPKTDSTKAIQYFFVKVCLSFAMESHRKIPTTDVMHE